MGMSQNTLLLAIVGVVVVLVIVALLVRRSSSRKSKPTPSKQKPAGTFCINCAAPLPLGAKFCNKCGATQP